MRTLVEKHRSDVFLILLGNFILACGVTFFILPYELLTGGIFGTANALKPLFPMIQETKTIAYALIVITFVLGALFLGKEFAVKTLLSSIVYPIYIELLSHVQFEVVTDPILASLYGGLLTGVAVGLVFRAKSSTGGMDVFPLLMEKYLSISPSKGVMIVDSVTVALGVSTLGIGNVLLGLISVFASSYAIDKVVMFGSENSKSVMIISDHYLLINQRIHEELERGTTLIKGQGGYSRNEKEIILCVITVEQYPILQDIINDIDEYAFVVVSEAHEIMGEGFSLSNRD